MYKKFYKIKNDVVFKILFSDKEILVWFLERVLGKEINNISIKDKKNNKDVDYDYIVDLIKQELVSNNRCVKSKIVDLLIKTDNEIIDIEYNNYFGKLEKRRNVAYLSNIYSVSVKSGVKYSEQPNCIQINLCSKLSNKFRCDKYMLNGSNYSFSLVDNLNFYVFNIAYYKKMLYNKDNNKLINKYKHLIMFDCDLDELKELSEGDYIMEKIYNKVKEINDEDAIYNYMSIEEDDEKMFLSKVQMGIDKGLDKAINMGFQNGVDVGYETGKSETLNDTAISLLKNNVSINVIKDVTGYSEEYIYSLMN